MLLTSSDPNVTPEIRSIIGMLMIAILGISLFLSQGAIMCTQVRTIKLRCKKRVQKRKLEKLMEEKRKKDLER